jgi:glycosyltransferase involved in cell wall biosynthesis
MDTLTIGYIAKTQVNALFVESLFAAIPLLKEELEYKVVIKSLLGKSNLPHARSILVTEWYDVARPGDLFMFIDTDQTFTHADIVQVIRQEGDLRAGIYANRAGRSTSIPEGGVFQSNTNAPLRYAGTGFLCFTYEATKRIHESIKSREGYDRVVITDNHPREGSVIPFFQPLLVETNGKTYWLGEDFSFSHRARLTGLKIVGAATPGLGHELSSVVHYRGKPTTQWEPETVVYYCGNSHVEFSPLDAKLGGAEQAVVHLSSTLQKKGKKVTVYGRVKPAIHNGVVYRRYEDFNPADTFEMLILWRAFGLQALPYIKDVKTLLVDLHDPTDPQYLPLNMMNRVTSVMVKSDYHRRIYSHLPDSKFTILPNGLQTRPALPKIKRDPTRFCYTSSYERGLIPILKYMWPRIRATLPRATFHIHYGRERLAPALLEELAPLLQQNGVVDHGRSTYEETLLERARSVAQLYLTSTPAEIDCLSIREAAALGCIPIISHYGVFAERAGIHVVGDPDTRETQEAGADVAINLSKMPETRRRVFIATLIKESLTTTWNEVTSQWIALSKPITTSTVQNRYSLVIMNFHRPHIVKRILDMMVIYTNVAQIIVSNGKKETAISYVHPKVTIFDDVAVNEVHGLDLRFLRMLRCDSEDVILIDDDILVEENELYRLLVEYEKDPHRIVGFWGRNCKKSTNGIKYTTQDAYGDVETVLTKILVCKRRLGYIFFHCKPLVEEIYRQGSPYGNGEDILFSFITSLYYDKPNFVLERTSIEDIGDDEVAVSKGNSHMPYRNKLCQFLYANTDAFKRRLAAMIYPTDRQKERLLEEQIAQKSDITVFEPKSKTLVLTISLGRDLIKITRQSMKNYAERVGADFLVLDDHSSFIIRHRSSFIGCKSGRDYGGDSYFLKVLVIHEYLNLYDKILWLDDSSVVGPTTENLFDYVEDGSVGAHHFDEDKAAPADVRFIKQTKGININKGSYINSGVVVYTKSLRPLFSLETIHKHAKLFESRYPHQAFLNYLLQVHNIPIVILGKQFNDMFLHYDYRSNRNMEQTTIDPKYIEQNQSSIFHITGWWKNRAGVLRNIVDHMNSIQNRPQSNHTIETKIVVFVPYCDYFEEFIVRSLQSIVDQNYTNYEVILVNDGSVYTRNIHEFIRDKPHFTLLNFEKREGPAASKWRFLNYLQQNLAHYTMNDICMIVDGDDYLSTDAALATINRTYQETKCWVTYGNCVGKFCERPYNVIPESWTDVRSNEFIYNHPRTFKLALATTFTEGDFKMNGEWLVKMTDHPIIFNTIEMAGKPRTKFIETMLYSYEEHANNSYKLVPNHVKEQQKNYVRNLTPKPLTIEPIHIIMCIWKRPENLSLQLENLNNQSVANRIHLHLLNNNLDNREVFEQIVAVSTRTYTNINITLSHYDNKYCAFLRFVYARDVLLRSFNIDYVIFMDDDQLFESTWVENLYNSRAPKTYMAWYCKKWTMDKIDYWDGSIVTSTDCKTGVKTDQIENMHYGATCGSIIDTTIFVDKSLLFEVPEDLPEGLTLYNGIEDLWLSFVVRKIYRWNIKRTLYKEQTTLNIPNSNSEKVSLYLNLRGEKQRLFEYLVAKYGL